MSIDRHLPPSTGLQNGRNFGLVIAMMLSPCRTKDGDLGRMLAIPQKRFDSLMAGFFVIVRPLGRKERSPDRSKARVAAANRFVLRDLRGKSRTKPASKSGDELPRIRDVGRVFRFTLER